MGRFHDGVTTGIHFVRYCRDSLRGQAATGAKVLNRVEVFTCPYGEMFATSTHPVYKRFQIIGYLIQLSVTFFYNILVVNPAYLSMQACYTILATHHCQVFAQSVKISLII